MTTTKQSNNSKISLNKPKMTDDTVSISEQWTLTYQRVFICEARSSSALSRSSFGCPVVCTALVDSKQLLSEKERTFSSAVTHQWTLFETACWVWENIRRRHLARHHTELSCFLVICIRWGSRLSPQFVRVNRTDWWSATTSAQVRPKNDTWLLFHLILECP